MRSDHIPFTNGVDNELVHKNILELLIKEKIMAIKKTEEEPKRADRTFKRFFKRSRNIQNQNSESPVEDKKLKIAIIEFPKNYYIQNYSFSNDEPVIINIEDPLFMQNGLDSISLYNIEITGDNLIDYNIDSNENNDFILKPNVDNLSISDNELLNNSSIRFSSNISKNKTKNNSIQDLESFTQKQQQQFSYETKGHKRKHSLETSKLSLHNFCFDESTGVNLDDQNFVKSCLSESDISKTSYLLRKSENPILTSCEVLSKPHYKKSRKRHDKRGRTKKENKAMKEVIGIEVLDSNDLPERARWTIIATAFLLLVMCLFLVGLTLRMAPLIDDIVRQENERLKFQSMKIQIANKENLTELRTPNTNYSYLLQKN